MAIKTWSKKNTARIGKRLRLAVPVIGALRKRFTMHREFKVKALLSLALIALAVVPFLSGCGSASTASLSAANKGPTFVIGTDAPMDAVTSFAVQINGITLTSDSGATASLISGTPTVDFARFNGLQTLLDMNAVPAGNYTSVTISLGSATIGYLDTTTTPPSITTMAATLTSNSVTMTLDKPLVVTTDGAPVGLRLDFDLQDSIAVDSSNQITGSVTPTFRVNTVTNDDDRAHIDEFIAAVVTPPTATTEPASFVVQGPHGQQFTVNTTSDTEWDGDASLSSLTTSSIVLLCGKLDKTTQTLNADEVVILSQTGFYAAGPVTYVTPPSGAATSFDFYVRGLLPTTTGLTLGQIATVNLAGTEDFNVHWMRNPFASFLFNSSGLVAGQNIAVGGSAANAADASNVTVNRVTLRNWGFRGTVVPGSQHSGDGSFQIQLTGFAGVLVPQTVTVYLGPRSDFRFGCSGFGNLSDGATVRVVGLLLKDPSNGNTVLLARHVDGNHFGDFATSNW